MNHGMFVGAGWRASFDAMTRILTALDDFLEEQVGASPG